MKGLANEALYRPSLLSRSAGPRVHMTASSFRFLPVSWEGGRDASDEHNSTSRRDRRLGLRRALCRQVLLGRAPKMDRCDVD